MKEQDRSDQWFDIEIAILEVALGRLGLDQCAVEKHTGSRQDNYVSLMLRHGDVPHLFELVKKWEIE